MILLGLVPAVIISMLTPPEPINYLFAILSASLNVAPVLTIAFWYAPAI
jgi:hypothetical protein